MKESFFAAPQPERVEKTEEEKARELLEQNAERQQEIEKTRAIWLSNVMKIEAAFAFNDTVADERLDVLRPARNKWLGHLDELDRLESQLKAEREDLESFLAN